MKKVNLVFVLVSLIFTIHANAQVSVEDQNTVKLGNFNNVIGTSDFGKYFQAQDVNFNSYLGLNLEFGNDESSGIHLDGDKIVIWSPGDNNLVNFCDEDLMIPNNYYDNAIIAYIDGDGYYYQISDSTKKEQIQSISFSLQKIQKMRGVEYYHKMNEANKSNKNTNNEEKTKNEGKVKNIGFLAQEVEAIIPEAVATNKAGIKYVNYQAIIPVLVEGIKEQQIQLTHQAQQIKDLQDQINKIQLTLKQLNKN